MWGILIVHIWRSVDPPHGAADRRGYRRILRSLYEAAAIDGANGYSVSSASRFRSDAGLKRLYHPGDKGRTDGLRLYYGRDQRRTCRVLPSPAFLIYENAFMNQKFSYAITQSVVIFVLMCVVSYFQFRTTRKED